MNKAAKICRIARESLYPPRCPCCDRVLLPEERSEGFCRTCDATLPRTEEPICRKCGKPLDNALAAYCHDCTMRRHAFVQGRGLLVYEGSVRDAMYRFKYSNRRAYRHAFATEAQRQYGWWIRDRGIDLIVPVPMFAAKRRKRGYNQAEEFANALSQVTDIPCILDAVLRIRSTAPQKGLSDRQRKTNLKDAFALKNETIRKQIYGRNVLVVDDIFTTGTTCDAVSEVLLMAGARAVYCMYICVGRGFS